MSLLLESLVGNSMKIIDVFNYDLLKLNLYLLNKLKYIAELLYSLMIYTTKEAHVVIKVFNKCCAIQ